MRLSALIALLFFTFIFQSKAQSNKDLQDKTLFRLGDQIYDLGTFEYYFLKNSERPSADSAKIKIEEYLELYINFRLKVQEATNRGMDQEKGFIDELDGYKKQLAEPYLTTTKFNQKLLAEAYERMKYEVSAAHILLKVEENALPEDTLRIYNQVLKIKDEINKGADFTEEAKKYSQDPSAKMNGGYLGYFSALQMVYPFENAAYQNPVGTVAGPIKTRFGYHLLKIIDNRPARGQVKVAHIMIKTTTDSVANEKAKKKTFSIYENLKEGKDWDEQCKLYSEDPSSAKAGGELRWFGTGALVPSFEDAAFALQNSGDISEPIQTRFGWHIIQLIDKKPLESFDEMKGELEKRVVRDSRSQDSQSEVLATLKKDQGFKLDEAVRGSALQKIDSTLKLGKWSYDPADINLSNVLFSLKTGTYTVADFYDYLRDEQRVRKTADLEEYKKQLYDRFETESIFDAEMAYIEQNNQDYRRILDEYRSGILLFNLMEDEVWEKALIDTVGLKTFYTQNSDKYMSQEMLVVRKLTSASKDVIDSVSSQLSLSNSQLDSAFNGQEALALQIDDLEIKKGEEVFLDNHWEVGTYLQESEGYFTLWVVETVNPAEKLPLDRVKGLAISDYQSELETRWLTELRAKYPYKLNKPVFKSFVKTF